MPYTAGGSVGKSIRLTRPFLDLGYAVLLPRTMAFTRLADLDGKTVGVQYASTPQTLLSVREGVRMATFRLPAEALRALRRGASHAALVVGPRPRAGGDPPRVLLPL